MGAAGSKAGKGKLKPDNISTVSMALESATNSTSSQPPTKPSRGNSSVRQQAQNGAVGYPPPPSTGAQVYSNKSNNSKTTGTTQSTGGSTSVRLNAGSGGNSTTKPSRSGVMDFNGNHFYHPANQQHSLGKASTTSSSYHRHYYIGEDSNNNNSIYQHDNNNNNSNTFKSSASVKVDIDKHQPAQPLRKTVARNHSSTSVGGSGGGGRGQSRLSQYSAHSESKSEVEKEKEKKAKMTKTGRKSGSMFVVFLLELVSLVGLAVLAFYLRFTDYFEVIKKDYECGDISLRQSKDGPNFKDSIIFGSLKATEYYLIFGLGPILMIFLFEIIRSLIIYSLSHSSSSDTVHQKKLGIPFPLLIRRTVRIIAGFLLGILLTTILVDVIKVQSGNLRPYFGTLCKKLTDFCHSHGGSINETLVKELCNDKSKETLREARLSFPSVSGAMAAYSATFIIFYISFSLPYRALRWARFWATLGLASVVFFTVNAGLATYQHHFQDMVVGLLIGTLFAFYVVFIHLNAFANRLSVTNLFSAKRAGEENVGNKKNIEGGQLSNLSDPFDETGSLSNRGSGSGGGLFGGNGENDKDWFWKNFHIPRVRQSARNMWRRSENYFSGRGRGGGLNGRGNDTRGTATSPRTQSATTATTNLARHSSNAYINPAFNGGGRNDDHILANHLHHETRFGGNGNGNGALGASSTANLHHPGANHRASSTLRTFQATSNA